MKSKFAIQPEVHVQDKFARKSIIKMFSVGLDLFKTFAGQQLGSYLESTLG